MKYGYIHNSSSLSDEIIRSIDVIHEQDVLIDDIYIEIDDSKKSFKKVKSKLHKDDTLVVLSIFSFADSLEKQIKMIQEILDKQTSMYLCDCDIWLSNNNNVMKLLDKIESNNKNLDS